MVAHPAGITNMLYLRLHLFLCRQSKGFVWLMCPDHSPSLRDVKAGAQGRAGAQKQGLRQRPWRKLLTCSPGLAQTVSFSILSFFFLPVFLYNQDHLVPGANTTLSWLVSPTMMIDHKNAPTDLPKYNLMETFSQLRFLLSDDSTLC